MPASSPVKKFAPNVAKPCKVATGRARLLRFGKDRKRVPRMMTRPQSPGSSFVGRRLRHLPRRRFVVHVLPKGFHRIRHYGFLASATKAANLATARERFNASVPHATTEDPAAADADADAPIQHCPCCGGRMHIIETFARGETPHHQPPPGIRIDTS